MNRLVSVLKCMANEYNSPNLPVNDTINGIKTAVAVNNEISRAIILNRTEKEQLGNRENQGNMIVTGDEMRILVEGINNYTQNKAQEENHINDQNNMREKGGREPGE